MKIDLAIWTAVNGYEWQPGSVYSPRELAGYKDAIGPLEQYSLPLGGLFLKDGKAVFYRVQIAERMDSRGRGAIYLVLGTVPVERAEEVDFAEIINSPEMAKPQKPFPTSIEHDAKPRECKVPLGREGFTERRFTGAETFADLGGWCAEAKGGKLKVRITGTMESPLFTVEYAPCVSPSKKEPAWPQERPFQKAEPIPAGPAAAPRPSRDSREDIRGEPDSLFDRQHRHTPNYGEPVSGAFHTSDVKRSLLGEEGKRKRGLDIASLVLGAILGFILASLVFLAFSTFGGKRVDGKSRDDGPSKIETRVPRNKDGHVPASLNGDNQERQ